MIPTEAIWRFQDAQKKLLRKTYDGAWRRGVDTYQPDPDPPQNPTLPLTMAVTGLTGAALLAARRRYQYVAPAYPDPVRRAVALAPAFTGVNKMGEELATLTEGSVIGAADAKALEDWAAANGWRLAAGSAVAWAGEQAGYAEAANTDGQYLYGWESVGDERVCPDCEILSNFPPLPLDQWPTAPGSGDTECSYGCRCNWETWPLDAGIPSSILTGPQQEMVDRMAIAQADALHSVLGDANYLE